MTGGPGTWVVAALELAGAAGFAAFWVVWWRSDHDEDRLPDGYVDHEAPFVWSDSMLAVLLTASAILLLFEEQLGESLSLVAGGMLLFLGVLDAAYFARTGLFAPDRGGVVNALVVIGVLALGSILVVRFA